MPYKSHINPICLLESVQSWPHWHMAQVHAQKGQQGLRRLDIVGLRGSVRAGSGRETQCAIGIYMELMGFVLDLWFYKSLNRFYHQY